MEIPKQLLRLYHGDVVAARAWLDHPHMLLEGERAADSLTTEEGRIRVQQLLDQIEAGFAV